MVRPLIVGEVGVEGGRSGKNLQLAHVLGVQEPQGVCVKAGLPFPAELGKVRLDVGLQSDQVGRPRLDRADGVKLERQVADTNAAEEGQGQPNDFGIQGRVIRAQRLDAKLLVLPVAAFLGALVAEVGGAVVKFGDAAARIQ